MIVHAVVVLLSGAAVCGPLPVTKTVVEKNVTMSLPKTTNFFSGGLDWDQEIDS
jgi:hypothetical protein